MAPDHPYDLSVDKGYPALQRGSNDRVAALEQQVAALRQANRDLRASAATEATAHTALLRRYLALDQRLAALEPYLQHRATCEALWDDVDRIAIYASSAPRACACGLEAARR